MGKATDNFEVYFGGRLRKIREQHGLTQKDFAKKLGLSASAVTQIEKGKKSPSLLTLRKISKALEIELASLFSTDSIYVFNIERLRTEFASADELTPATYKALGVVVQYARDISFLRP